MNGDLPKEKRWKDLYTRSVKSRRAQQLGIDYPIRHPNQKLQSERLNVLFICSMNKWRSPTAESIYGKKPLINARSAGTSSKARHQVSAIDLKWADVVIVMESKHRQRLQADFPDLMRSREVHVLGIEDNFQYMDPELIEELKSSVDPILVGYV